MIEAPFSLRMMNACLKSEAFPVSWKSTRLVFIEKRGVQDLWSFRTSYTGMDIVVALVRSNLDSGVKGLQLTRTGDDSGCGGAATHRILSINAC